MTGNRQGKTEISLASDLDYLDYRSSVPERFAVDAGKEVAGLLLAQDASRIDMQGTANGVHNGDQSRQKHGECNHT
jgi:hypothetical protein